MNRNQFEIDYETVRWRVFPCQPRGKAPLTEHGFKDATTDPATIRRWWTKHPTANIGIATGKVSGIVAIDVDWYKPGVREAFDELTDRLGKLPATVEGHTGGGGLHLIFQHPGGHIPCSKGKLAEGVDVKADGGHIVVAPSVHKCGKRYMWELSSDPTEGVKPADLPEPWIRAIRGDTLAHPDKSPTDPGAERRSNRPVFNVLHAIETRTGKKPQQQGESWSANCPAHDDRKPSLSVSEGDDGRVLLYCHAGCRLDAILEALGLRKRDLFPPGEVPPDKTTSDGPESEILSVSECQEHAHVYPTARDAVAELDRKLGKHTTIWTYRNSDGEPVGVVVRWDCPDGGKDIRPVSRNGNGWIIGAMRKPRPLYQLPALAGAKRVFIVEGEKAADALIKLGLTATTSAGGSQGAAQADWSPLAGKECVIWPDNDEPGARYADVVARMIATYAPDATVKRIKPPKCLAPRGDAVDYVANHRAKGKVGKKIRSAIAQLANKASQSNATQRTYHAV